MRSRQNRYRISLAGRALSSFARLDSARRLSVVVPEEFKKKPTHLAV
jgi:hypothetical protein